MKKVLLGLLFSFLNLLSYSQIAVNEGFEGATTPTGWAYSGFSRISTTNGYPCTGTGALLSGLIFNSSPSASSTYSSVNSNGNAIAVSFKYRAEAGNPSNPVVTGDIRAEYSNNNGATYYLIGSPIAASASSSCTTFTGTIPQGSIPIGANFKFRITANNSGTGYWVLTVDDVVLAQTASCNVPAGISVTNITSTNAQLNWTSSNTPTNGFEVYYNTTNTPPNTSTVPILTGVSGTSVNIGPLLSNKTYYVWVRANCGSNISSWSNVQTFSTPCGIYSLPYNENFETTTLSTIPACTTQENGLWWAYPIEAGLGFNQGKGLGYNFSNTSISNTWWYTPQFNLQGGVTYSLKFKRGNKSLDIYNKQRLKVAFGNSATSSSMTNIIKDFSDPLISNSISEILYFTPSTSGIYNVGFNAYTPSGFTYGGYLLIDDIAIDVATNCKTPGNIIISSITETTATVNWDASISNPAEGYDVYYNTNNIQPISTTVPNHQGVSGLSRNLASLLPGKNYYVWVRSRCSATELSDWKQAIFSTACAPSTTIPYTENFESSFAGSLPLCTSVENTSTGDNWIIINPSIGFWPTKALFLNFYSTTVSNSSWFYTQGIYVESGKQYKMTYLYGDRNVRNSYPVKLKVAYGNAPNSISMTNILSDHQTIPNQDQNSAESTFTVPVTGIYYFGFNGYSSGAENFIAIDNINIVENGVLAVGNVSKKEDISLYPNPFKEVLNISDVKNIKSITINDISGKLIRNLAPIKELHLQDLSAGVYTVTLIYKDGSGKSFKVMKK